jgi:hypothetical protein
MREAWVVPVILLGCVLLAAPAAGQDQIGACWRLDELDAGCVPDVTEQECIDIYFWTEPIWNGGADCTDLDVPFEWDGSCLGDVGDVGDRCVLLWADPQNPLTSIEHCAEDGGLWFDNLTCEGAPVPAMPNPGLALMVFALMGIALMALTARGS